MKSDDQIKRDWKEFANQAYMDWRGNTRKTITEFAEFVGISQALMSRELSGAVPREQSTIAGWVGRYGVEVYEVLGIPLPPDSIEALPEPWRSISREIRETLAEYSVSGDSPEAQRLAAEILKKHGYHVSTTSNASS